MKKLRLYTQVEFPCNAEYMCSKEIKKRLNTKISFVDGRIGVLFGWGQEEEHVYVEVDGEIRECHYSQIVELKKVWERYSHTLTNLSQDSVL